MKLKKLTLLSMGMIMVVPIISISCIKLDLEKGRDEEFVVDFSMSRIDTETKHYGSWLSQWTTKMNDSERYEDIEILSTSTKIERRTNHSENNKYSQDFVNNLLSSSRNPQSNYGSRPNDNLRAHYSVSVVSDTSSTLMSVISNNGYLKEVESLGIKDFNINMNPNLLKVAIDNSSKEISGVRQQIGVPYAFNLQGVRLEYTAMIYFNEKYNTGIFDDLLIAGVKMKDIIKSQSDQYEDLLYHVQNNGWSWNEMMNLADVLKSSLDTVDDRHDDRHIISDEYGMELDGFIFADRFDSEGNAIWKGISDDWNGDIMEELALQNNISENEVKESMSNFMELLVPNSDGSRPWSNPIFLTANTPSYASSEKYVEPMPMPLYTGGGDDVYDDLVIGTNSLFFIDEEQFFSSELGLNFRDDFIELLLYRTYDGDEKLSYDFTNYISPYTSTGILETNSSKHHQTQDLLDALFSDSATHSVSSQRWAGTWFKDTLSNSVEWSGGPALIDRESKFAFSPISSLDRDINLYDKYELNID